MSTTFKLKVPRFVLVSLGTFAVLFALTGVAHTRAARPLMIELGRALGVGPSCPLGYDKAFTVEQEAAGRKVFAQTHAGTVPAKSRNAWGLELGRTTRADLTQWSQQNGFTCITDKKAQQHLECSEQPAAGGYHQLLLELDEHDTLARLRSLKKTHDVATISNAFVSLERDLTDRAGKPTQADGDATSEYLASGALRQAHVEFQAADFFALLRASNTGDGYLLIEDYRAL